MTGTQRFFATLPKEDNIDFPLPVQSEILTNNISKIESQLTVLSSKTKEELEQRICCYQEKKINADTIINKYKIGLEEFRHLLNRPNNSEAKKKAIQKNIRNTEKEIDHYESQSAEIQERIAEYTTELADSDRLATLPARKQQLIEELGVPDINAAIRILEERLQEATQALADSLSSQAGPYRSFGR